MVRTKKTSEVLKYTFSAEELLEKARESAQATSSLSGAEETLKEVSAQFKADIAKYEKRILELSRLINQGYEYRNIDCEWHMDTPEPGKKSLFRLDDGRFIREETMDEAEKQAELPLEGGTAVN